MGLGQFGEIGWEIDGGRAAEPDEILDRSCCDDDRSCVAGWVYDVS